VDNNKVIVEGFGGFLNTVKQFISGVGKDALEDTIFSSKNKKGDQDFPASLYSAEIIRSALINAVNTIDNILVGMNPDDKENAENSASDMLDFLESSFKKVQGIIEDRDSGDMTEKEMNSTLSEISKKLDIMTRPGGVLQKWKNEFLGANSEKLLSNEYLNKGNDLVKKGREIYSEVAQIKDLKDRIDSSSFDKLIQRSIDFIETGDSRPRKPSNIKTFGKDSKDQDPEVVKDYKKRLEKLGLRSNDIADKFGKSDQENTKKAMQYIGTVNGKVYNDSDEALRDFQKDLGIYVDKQEEIKKILGL